MSFNRSQFDHVGIPTEIERPGERFLEATRVWVTNPRTHPMNIEYVRFATDSPVTGPVRDQIHIAYRTNDIMEDIKGHHVLLEPFPVGDNFAQVAFVLIDGEVIELMQYSNPDESGWW